MVSWRIYYGDKSSFDSEDGLWDQAPLDGVVCVVTWRGEIKSYFSGADLYRMFDDGSVGASSDWNSWLRTAVRSGEVKFGLFVSNTRFEEIMKRAREDVL